MDSKIFRILSLDGGGSKGCYTIGVLESVEAMLGSPLHEHFDLIYGTSTGSIIGSLIAIGKDMSEIKDLYKSNIPVVMAHSDPGTRSKSLNDLANRCFEERTFKDTLVPLGVVTTDWSTEKPRIFKSYVGQAHGSIDSFRPGFGALLSEVVESSCSATPFFLPKTIQSDILGTITLIDGGFCANNPTLFAIIDALSAMNVVSSELKVLSVGVGQYPLPKSIKNILLVTWANWNSKGSVDLLQRTLSTNANTMEQICAIHYKDTDIFRINDAYLSDHHSTDLLESNPVKLDMMFRFGGQSFNKYENEIRKLLLTK